MTIFTCIPSRDDAWIEWCNWRQNRTSNVQPIYRVIKRGAFARETVSHILAISTNSFSLGDDLQIGKEISGLVDNRENFRWVIDNHIRQFFG